MFQNLLLLFAITTLVASCQPQIFSDKIETQASRQKIMSSQANILISPIILQAREEKSLPSGATPKANRDIGFASVFMSLENLQEVDVELTINKIEIRNTADNRLQIAQSSPQKIVLKPLEKSEEVFHLTNKTGYSKNNKVKAIITYQIDDQVEVIESKPTEIERF